MRQCVRPVSVRTAARAPSGRGEGDSRAGGKAGQRTGKFVIECKVLHKTLERTIRDGLEQTAAYMDRCAAEAGHLVIFDRSDRAWDDKVFHSCKRIGGADVHVWGM